MMTDENVRAALDRADIRIAGYQQVVDRNVTGIKQAVREDCIRIREEISVRISVTEISLIRHLVVLTHDAEYHLIRAYFHASPSLILFITALYTAVMVIVNFFDMINSILKVITGETLAFWVDKLFPGFQNAWLDLMRKVSEFSGALGWGVDGVQHLMNVGHVGADLWGTVFNKEIATVKMEKVGRTQLLLQSYKNTLSAWQANPGAQIASYAERASGLKFFETRNSLANIFDKVGTLGDKAEKAFTDIGTISSELLAVRNDMPAFVAKNIPQGIWDGIQRVDTTINDRILPALQDITDKLDELDAVLDSYRAKAEALADRIAHPGDMLAEIDKLPGYARSDQLVKIDSVTSTLMREQNEAEYKAMEAGLKQSALIAAALSRAPAPLPFMELELPGRSPGIVAEPRETWFVGDY